jgi:PTEN induced putative kinase 1
LNFLKILTCQSGPKSYLDYSKSDLWASGSLFYEFFSQSNPFFHGTLKQENYDDKNLPSISSLSSPILERLIHSILRKNPEKVFIFKS